MVFANFFTLTDDIDGGSVMFCIRDQSIEINGIENIIIVLKAMSFL